jgi:uncharacterized protein (DUF3820 family)
MAALMPFGRHQGHDVNRLPLSYLRWIKMNIRLNGWLKEAVETILAGRPYLDALELERLIHQVVRDAETQMRDFAPVRPDDGDLPRRCGSG